MQKKASASDKANPKAKQSSDDTAIKRIKSNVTDQETKPEPVEDQEVNTAPPDESKLTAFQLAERKKRTCFVGNLAIETTGRQVKQLFTGAGCKVEKLWFRSIAV